MRAKISLLVCFSLIVQIAAAQGIEERKLPHFDKLKVTHQVKVYLSRGDAEMVKVIARGIEPSDVITEVVGKTLEITLKRGVYKDISVEVWVTYRDLRDIYSTASATIVVESIITGDKIVLSAFTGSQIDAQLSVRTADINLDKGANINLKGEIGSFEAKVASGAILSALELSADSVYVNANTRGVAKVFAKSFIDANIRTGSTLTLKGNPPVKKVKSGFGATILEQ
jgi:hypothetical protein